MRTLPCRNPPAHQVQPAPGPTLCRCRGRSLEGAFLARCVMSEKHAFHASQYHRFQKMQSYQYVAESETVTPVTSAEIRVTVGNTGACRLLRPVAFLQPPEDAMIPSPQCRLRQSDAA